MILSAALGGLTRRMNLKKALGVEACLKRQRMTPKLLTSVMFLGLKVDAFCGIRGCA